MRAVMLLQFGCRGFTKAARSSGTMTEGTNSIGDRNDASQAEPIFTLAWPAGIVDHAGGSEATSRASAILAHSELQECPPSTTISEPLM